jgi:hypothetical protein
MRRTEPRRLTPSEQQLAASLDPAVPRRLIELRHVARLALLPDISQPILGVIAAEVRRIREQMDDALDGQAGRWACGTDLTPDNRHNIR